MSPDQCSGYTARGVRCENAAIILWKGMLALCRTHQAKHNDAILEIKRAAVNKHMIELHRIRTANQEQRANRNFVYFIRAGHKIKIGYATNPEQRLKKIRSGTSGAYAPVNLDTSRARLLAVIEGDRKREHELHRQFQHLKVSGEWFKAKPELIDFIKEVAA